MDQNLEMYIYNLWKGWGSKLPEVTLDIFDLDGEIRYFVEAEFVTSKLKEIDNMTNMVISVLSELLGKNLQEEKQAPTMLQLLIEQSKK
jgi:hypothetical protein